jgi:hypothetical protein
VFGLIHLSITTIQILSQNICNISLVQDALSELSEPSIDYFFLAKSINHKRTHEHLNFAIIIKNVICMGILTKLILKKCDNVVINAIDSNTYPYYVLLCLFMQ